MRREYIRSLKEIEDKMLEMGNAAEQSIEFAMESLINRDLSLAKQVVDGDDVIDNYEKDIETEIIKLLTLQNPVARDFRRVASVFKIITDIERIGDLSVNIAKLSLEIGEDDFIKPLIDLPKMYKIVTNMLNDSLKAFIDSDTDLAVEVAQQDDKVDDLHVEINEELLEMIAKKSEIMDQALKLMFISRYLERMADHVTNICERIIYIETNKVTTNNV